MANLATLAQALKKLGIKNADEADPATVQKIIKSLKGESDDAVAKLGSGKNLEALQRAKVAAPAMEAPAYPKNISQDALSVKPEQIDSGFSMPHPDAQLPVVQNAALVPEVLPAVNQQMPLVLAQAGKPGMSGLQKGGLAAAGLGAGALGLSLMNNDQQADAADLPTPATPVPVAAEATQPEPTKSAPTTAPQAQKQFSAMDLASNLKDNYGDDNQTPSPTTQPDYNALLQNAQQGQNDNSFINNLLKAGQTIGSAVSRGGQKPDYSVADSLQSQAGQGVQNVLQQMKSRKDQYELTDDKNLRDPASDVSKAFRSTLDKLGIPYSDKTTAWDAKAMGINPQNLIMQNKSIEQAREMKQLMLGERDKNQAYSAVEAGIRNTRNGVAYKAYENTKNAQDALDNALLTGDKVAAGTAFLRAAKVAQGDDSVVRSDDMKVLLGGTNYSPAAYTAKMKDLASGKNITDRELQAMQNIMKMVKQKEGLKVYQQMSPHLTKINQSGLDLNSHFDPSELEELSKFSPNQQPKATTAAPAGGMVKVTNIATGQSKMMSAEQAARAPKDKYTVGQ